MDLKSAIYGRRSVRLFNKKKVEPVKIKKIIEYGTNAPTACNIQGWHFIVIENPEIKKWLVDSGSPLFIEKAQSGILVLYDNRTGNNEYKDYLQSAGATIQNMLLAAHEQGLGACWICRLPSQSTLRKFFKIPKTYDVVAYIAIGYTDKNPLMVKRKHEYKDIVSKDTFKGKVTKGSLKRSIYLMVPKPIKLFARLCLEGRFFRKR